MASRISLARNDIRRIAEPAPLALVGGAPTADALVPVGDGAQRDVAPVEELLTAWKADPRCFQCGRHIDSVRHAALLIGPMRVAHRDGCFIPALLRVNPQLHLISSNESPSVLPLNDARDREPHRG
ncbi:MAG TPA: hypothetical protein VF166_09010 [Gemmatimonadaceae bacterium]